MSTPINKYGELPNTYTLQNRINKDGLTRVIQQDQIFTKKMGGTLAEQPNPTIFTSVLDIGCGAGCWLIEVAKTYPMIPHLIGIDISGKMVEYAQKQAEVQQVDDRVQFRQMDALSALDFPALHFDLVNQRVGGTFLRTWDWPKWLEEVDRVLRPGGLIRITDMEDLMESTSPALLRLQRILFQVFHQAGHFQATDHSGLIAITTHLLKQYGFQNIQTRIHKMEFRAGTPEGEYFTEDLKFIYQMLIPFFNKWIRLPPDYQETYQEMLRDIQEPDFMAMWPMFTTWGYKR